MTATMAIVDFIPVLLFALFGIGLMRDLYNKLSKGAFALLSAGVLMIVTAGGYKALWKLLYALEVCDFEMLNRAFFPMQSTGFMLLGLGMAAGTFFPQGKHTVYAAPAVFSGTMIFVAFMILGAVGLCGSMTALSLRMKKRSAAALFVLGFVLILGMGYLSSRDVGVDAAKNWAAECTNTLAQLTLLLGLRTLEKSGLRVRTSMKE